MLWKFAALCALPLLAVSPAQAAVIALYGAPAYTPGVAGYQGGGIAGIADDGTAFGWATKYDATGVSLGTRGIRWNASGATAELGSISTRASTGGSEAYVIDVNGSGTAVGRARKFDASGADVGFRAVRWDASGTAAVELGNLGTGASGFANAAAVAVNRAGTAAGSANKYVSGSTRGERAVRWDASGTAATELGDIGNTFGSAYVRANAINDAGMIVGEAEKWEANGSYKGYRAVRWNPAGTAATELGHLGTSTGGTTDAYARAVNNAGVAVGYADKYDASGNNRGVRAVRWDATGTAATELGTLAATPNSLSLNYAYAMNDAGTAVGYTDKSGSSAVRWKAAGTAAQELTNLGTNSGSTIARANDINSFDFVVGYARTYSPSGQYLDDHAVYWNPDGSVVDLNTLIDPNSGWVLRTASAISDSGWIAGHGWFDPDGIGVGQIGYNRLFLMQVPATAIPEPSAAIAIAGVLGVTRLPRRRRT